MPRTNTQSSPATSGNEPYYLRLRPVMEYEYVADRGVKLAEVAVYDDRPTTGKLYLQLKPLFNGRFKKGANATFAFDTPERLRELAADIAEVADLL